MNKTVLAAFSGLLLAISLLGVHDPQNSIQWIFASNPQFDALRIGIAAIMLGYGFIPQLREHNAVITLKVVGTLLPLIVIFGFFGTGSDTMRLYPLDVFSFMEAGIIAILLSFQMQDDAEMEKSDNYTFQTNTGSPTTDQLPTASYSKTHSH